MVLEPQVGVAASAALARLLLGQPGVLVVELVAQAIEEGVHTVVDQASFAEGHGRGVEQVVAQFGRQGGQLGPGLAQGLQGRADALLEQPRQPRQPLQAIGQGHQVAGGGAAGAGAARQALQIPHRPQQPPQGQPQGAMLHQLPHGLLAHEDRGPLHQGGLDPTPQAAAPHGGGGAIEGPEQRAVVAAAQLGAGEL